MRIRILRVIHRLLRPLSEPSSYIANFSPRLRFISFAGDHDWLDIKWGKGNLRLEIFDDHIHINCYPLNLEKDAINAITISPVNK